MKLKTLIISIVGIIVVVMMLFFYKAMLDEHKLFTQDIQQRHYKISNCEQERGEEIREFILECLDKGGWVNSCRNTAINSYCH